MKKLSIDLLYTFFIFQVSIFKWQKISLVKPCPRFLALSIYQSIYLPFYLSVQAVARTGAVQDRRRVWCTQDKKQSGLWKGTWSNSTRYISTVVQLYISAVVQQSVLLSFTMKMYSYSRVVNTLIQLYNSTFEH